MPKSLTDFIQKFLSFVQIPKSFVQKHETKTAETGENDGSIRRELQQHARKTTAVSGKTTPAISKKNIPKSLTDSVQKFLSFVQEQIFLYKTRPKQREKIRKKKESFPEKASEFIKLDNNYKS